MLREFFQNIVPPEPEPYVSKSRELPIRYVLAAGDGSLVNEYGILFIYETENQGAGVFSTAVGEGGKLWDGIRFTDEPSKITMTSYQDDKGKERWQVNQVLLSRRTPRIK